MNQKLISFILYSIYFEVEIFAVVQMIENSSMKSVYLIKSLTKFEFAEYIPVNWSKRDIWHSLKTCSHGAPSLPSFSA